jgi:hypothetical protein
LNVSFLSFLSFLSFFLFSLQGWSRDDTALNAVRVRCSGRDGVQTATDLIPGGLGGGNFGSW